MLALPLRSLFPLLHTYLVETAAIKKADDVATTAGFAGLAAYVQSMETGRWGEDGRPLLESQKGKRAQAVRNRPRVKGQCVTFCT